MLLPEVMRMKKIKKFLTQKQSFYGLVAVVGILALGAFATVDQIRTKNLEEQVQKVELAESNNVAEEHKTPVLVESEEQELPKQAEQNTTSSVGQSAIVMEEKKEPAKEEEEKKETETPAYDGTTKLKWPLSGNVVLPYSMDSTIYFQTLDQYQCNPGMMIQATDGADVKNIAPGKVVNVDKTSKYGTTVTVDIGNNYQITYGQLKDVNWKKGDLLEADALIGRVAPVTEFFTLEGNHLYFEMKKDKKPVNPMKYLE